MTKVLKLLDFTGFVELIQSLTTPVAMPKSTAYPCYALGLGINPVTGALEQFHILLYAFKYRDDIKGSRDKSHASSFVCPVIGCVFP